MKRCPECRRDYTDETLNYCLDDGAALLEGPGSAEDLLNEPGTEILPVTKDVGNAPTLHPVGAGTRSVSNASSAEYLIGVISKHRVTAILSGVLAVAAVGVLIYLVYRFGGNAADAHRSSSAGISMRPLTATGNVRNVAISPDGKFLAFIRAEAGQESVWTKQISTNSDIQIVPPMTNGFFPLTFNPGGDYVYYGIPADRAVYRIPTLGGTSTKIISNCDCDLSFSADGTHMLFERFDTTTRIWSLIVADPDGSNERVVKTVDGPKFIEAAAISPSGKEIAVALWDQTAHPTDTVVIEAIEGGEFREFAKQRWDAIGSLAWLADGSSVILCGSNKGANLPTPIWSISYPSGEVRQISTDLNDYRAVSVTSDSRQLVALQTDNRAGIWVSSDTDINKAQQISKGRSEGGLGISWTGDERIVYGSTASGASEIWIANKDGSNPRQLTFDGISKYTPAASPDNRYIVFISERDGGSLWRIYMDGSQPTKMTSSTGDADPRISPDGKWVVYDSLQSGLRCLYRVPIDGGESQKLADFQAFESDISPDGKYVAYFTYNQADQGRAQIGVMPFDGGTPIKTFDVPQTVHIDMSVGWTPDGKGITYVDRIGNNSNLWLQPFDGGSPKKITDYKEGMFLRREWTRNGKQIAIVKGSESSDAVMITDFR